MIVARLSIAPLDKGISVSKYVKIALNEIKKSGLHYEINAMSTVIEAEDIESLMDVVKKAHQAVVDMGSNRIITDLKIDDRRDKEHTIKRKLKSLE